MIEEKVSSKPEIGKNTSYLTDFTRLTLSPNLFNFNEIRALYLEKGLFTAQIANQESVILVAMALKNHPCKCPFNGTRCGIVGYPDTKPMSTVAKGVFEIRLKDASGIFRTFYLVKTEHGIIVFHSFKKKSQKTPKHEVETGRLRLNAYLKELNDENSN